MTFPSSLARRDVLAGVAGTFGAVVAAGCTIAGPRQRPPRDPFRFRVDAGPAAAG